MIKLLFCTIAFCGVASASLGSILERLKGGPSTGATPQPIVRHLHRHEVKIIYDHGDGFDGDEFGGNDFGGDKEIILTDGGGFGSGPSIVQGGDVSVSHHHQIMEVIANLVTGNHGTAPYASSGGGFHGLHPGLSGGNQHRQGEGLHNRPGPGLHNGPGPGFHNGPGPGLHNGPGPGVHNGPGSGHRHGPSPSLHSGPSPGFHNVHGSNSNFLQGIGHEANSNGIIPQHGIAQNIIVQYEAENENGQKAISHNGIAYLSHQGEIAHNNVAGGFSGSEIVGFIEDGHTHGYGGGHTHGVGSGDTGLSASKLVGLVEDGHALGYGEGHTHGANAGHSGAFSAPEIAGLVEDGFEHGYGIRNPSHLGSSDLSVPEIASFLEDEHFHDSSGAHGSGNGNGLSPGLHFQDLHNSHGIHDDHSYSGGPGHSFSLR